MSGRPIIADRVRRIGGHSFAFIPHRFLREGFLSSLTLNERSLYLFLVLAADRQGLSFWSYDRICSVLELHLDLYIEARNGLIDKDLIAFDGRHFQVLELPTEPKHRVSPPLCSRADMEENDPATVHTMALESITSASSKH
jgi:hypothetical protein